MVFFPGGEADLAEGNLVGVRFLRPPVLVAAAPVRPRDAGGEGNGAARDAGIDDGRPAITSAAAAAHAASASNTDADDRAGSARATPDAFARVADAGCAATHGAATADAVVAAGNEDGVHDCDTGRRATDAGNVCNSASPVSATAAEPGSGSGSGQCGGGVIGVKSGGGARGP